MAKPITSEEMTAYVEATWNKCQGEAWRREDIIRMAKKAGFDPHDMSDDFTCNLEDIERFAALVAEHEREQCALIAAHILKMPQNDISTLIRVRGMRHE